MGKNCNECVQLKTIEDLKERIALLEKEVQVKHTSEEIINEISNRLTKSVELLKPI